MSSTKIQPKKLSISIIIQGDMIILYRTVTLSGTGKYLDCTYIAWQVSQIAFNEKKNVICRTPTFTFIGLKNGVCCVNSRIRASTTTSNRPFFRNDLILELKVKDSVLSCSPENFESTSRFISYIDFLKEKRSKDSLMVFSNLKLLPYKIHNH